MTSHISRNIYNLRRAAVLPSSCEFCISGGYVVDVDVDVDDDDDDDDDVDMIFIFCKYDM